MAALLRTLPLVALLAAVPTLALAEPTRGFWLSPDWILDASARAATAESARRATAEVLDRLAGLKVNTIFMETYLRGYAVGPIPDKEGRHLPVYALTRWTDGPDLLSIVVEEGKKRRIEVHAWVHVFFWKTDNPARVRPHHGGRTIWDDLVVEYLRSGAGRLTGQAAAAISKAADLIESSGYDDHALVRLLKDHGYGAGEGTLGTMVGVLRSAGVPPPSFLVTTAAGDVHLPGSKDPWMTLYLNPDDQRVTQRLLYVINRISTSYPGLAGVHLDHIRYPRGPLALPADLNDLKPGATLSQGSSLTRRWKQCLRVREESIAAFVRRVKGLIADGQTLSAAVHPLYYFDRDEWASSLSGDDFVSQAWYDWGLDLAVPMIYESDGPRIGRIMKRHRFGLAEAQGGSGTTRIVPGTNLIKVTRPGSGVSSWVYFDFGDLKSLTGGEPPAARPRPLRETRAAGSRGSSSRRRPEPASEQEDVESSEPVDGMD